MSEQLVATIIPGALGLALVLFTVPIAAWYCGYMKRVWMLDRGGLFAKVLEGVVWVVERVSLGRVYDEATAPKMIRFMGFAFLGIALVNGLSLL